MHPILKQVSLYAAVAFLFIYLYSFFFSLSPEMPAALTKRKKKPHLLMPPPLCSFFFFPLSLASSEFGFRFSVSPGPQRGLLAVYVRGEAGLAPRLRVRSACIYICLAPGARSLEPGACFFFFFFLPLHPGHLPRRLQRDLWTESRGPMNGSQSGGRLHH